MKTLKFVTLFIVCLLLQACPYDDSPDFMLIIRNDSGEDIHFHSRGFESIENVPENAIVEWDPRINEGLFIASQDSIERGYDFGSSSSIKSIRIYKASTLEANDWEIVRDNGLYDARYDLTLEELEAMDFEIVYDGM